MALINAVDCNKVDLNLGITDCELRLGEFKSFILTPKSWSVAVEDLETMDLEYVVGLVQAGTWQPVLNSVEFTNNTPEPTTKEYTGGVTSVIRNGKPQYMFEFDNGIGFHKAAYSKNSFQRYNVLLVDESGNLVGATSGDGTRFTGLSASMVNTRTYVPKTGDETPKTLIEFQLDNEAQFNQRMAIITVAQSGVDINTDVNAIVGVTITGTAEAGDPINIQVNGVNNSILGVEALTVSNFRVTNVTSGATVALTSVTEGATEGSYLLTPTTPTTAGQVLKVELYDAEASVNVALIEPNQLYKGSTLPPHITVASVIVVMIFSNVFSTIFG